MKIRILVQPTGLLNGRPWAAVGETADVPDVVAIDLLNAGFAEPVKGSGAETATATPKAETAVKPKGRTRKAG